MRPTAVRKPSVDNCLNLITKEIAEQYPDYQHFNVIMQPELAPLQFLRRCTCLLRLGIHFTILCEIRSICNRRGDIVHHSENQQLIKKQNRQTRQFCAFRFTHFLEPTRERSVGAKISICKIAVINKTKSISSPEGIS